MVFDDAVKLVSLLAQTNADWKWHAHACGYVGYSQESLANNARISADHDHGSTSLDASPQHGKDSEWFTLWDSSPTIDSLLHFVLWYTPPYIFIIHVRHQTIILFGWHGEKSISPCRKLFNPAQFLCSQHERFVHCQSEWHNWNSPIPYNHWQTEMAQSTAIDEGTDHIWIDVSGARIPLNASSQLRVAVDMHMAYYVQCMHNIAPSTAIHSLHIHSMTLRWFRYIPLHNLYPYLHSRNSYTRSRVAWCGRD